MLVNNERGAGRITHTKKRMGLLNMNVCPTGIGRVGWSWGNESHPVYTRPKPKVILR